MGSVDYMDWNPDEDIPRPVRVDADGVPIDETARYEWDRTNSLLKREWQRFYERVEEHAKEFQRTRGQEFGQTRRGLLVAEFAKRLIKVYGASDTDSAWRAFDERRSMNNGKVAR